MSKIVSQAHSQEDGVSARCNQHDTTKGGPMCTCMHSSLCIIYFAIGSQTHKMFSVCDGVYTAVMQKDLTAQHSSE